MKTTTSKIRKSNPSFGQHLFLPIFRVVYSWTSLLVRGASAIHQCRLKANVRPHRGCRSKLDQPAHPQILQSAWQRTAPVLCLAAVLCLGTAATVWSQVIGGPTLYVSGGLFANTPTNQPLLFTWRSHIEIRGEHWDANSTLSLYLYGPLNTLGVQPTNRFLGVITTDNNGGIAPGIDYDPYVTVPYDNGTIGAPDVTRPGNYEVYALDDRKPLPRLVYASQRINLCPRTDTFIIPDGQGFDHSYNWTRSRGGRDGWLGDISPERADPEWISIWSEDPVGIYGTVAPTEMTTNFVDPPANQPSFIAHADAPFSHYGHDWNVDLVPDTDYRWVLANANFTSETEPGKSNNGRIECEWETLNNGTPFYGSYGQGNIGLPIWAMPTAGDRMYLVGRWVLDNGHPDDGDRSEIHPPRLVATMRKRNTAIPFNDGTNSMTRASQVDIYVSGHGGGANHFPDGLSATLDNQGAGGGMLENVLSSQDLATYFAWGPSDSSIYEALQVLLNESFYGDILTSAGPSGLGWANGPEFRPTDTMNYDFDVPLPPAPPGAVNPLVKVVAHPENTASTDAVITYTTPDPSTGLPTMAHIHMPFQGVENGIYAHTLFFYWDTYSPPGNHFVVELKRMRTFRILRAGDVYNGPQPFYLWADICGQWTSLTDLAPADLLTPRASTVPAGVDKATFPPGSAKFDVYLDDADTLRIYTMGYAQRDFDNFFGVDVGLPVYDAGLHLALSTLFYSGENENPGGALFESSIATAAEFDAVQGYHTNDAQNIAVNLLNGEVVWLPAFSVEFNVTYVPEGEITSPTRAWIGGSGAFSNPANWSPNGVPQNGEQLIFDNAPGSEMTNDITGLSVQSLEFTHSGTLSGQDLTVTSSITAQSSDSGSIDINIPSLHLGGDIAISEDNTTVLGLTLNCQVDLNGHTPTVSSAPAGAVIFQNRIYGTGDLDFTAGNNFLDNQGASANSFDGRVTVSGGTLWLDSPTAPAIPSDLLIEYGAGVVSSRDYQTADTTTVEIFGGGYFLLDGRTTAVGDLVLNNIASDLIPCTVDTGNGGLLGINGAITGYNDSSHVTPIIEGRISLNSQTPIWTYGSAFAGLDLPAQIIGNSFTKSGNNPLILRGTNSTFTGEVDVRQGTLDVRSSGALGPSSGVLLSGGALTLRTSIADHSLEVNGSAQITPETAGSMLIVTAPTNVTWSGPILLDTNLVIYGGDITLGGVISGTGGLDFRNPGTVLLTGTGANTFTGTTRVRCVLLEFNKPSGTTAFNGPLVVGGGSGGPHEARWLDAYQHVDADVTLYSNGIVNLNNYSDDFGSLTFNGGEVDTGTGQMGIYGPVTVNATNPPATINGILGLPSGVYPNNPFIVNDSPGEDCDLTINATILGPGNLVKQGSGTLCLSGHNTYTGVTFVNNGILEVDYDLALGANNIGEGTSVSDGATLRLVPGVTLSEPLTLSGTGFGGTNGALNVSGAMTFNSAFAALNYFALSAPATIRVDGAASTFVVNSIVSGTGPLTKAGPGRMVTYGNYANTYSGDTIVAEGTLELNKPQNVISAPGNLVIGPAPSAAPAAVRFDTTGEMGGDTVTVNANGLLDLNGNNQTLSQLNLNDGGDVQTGTGTLYFPASANSLVMVGSLSATGSHHSSTITGNIALQYDGTVTFAVSPYSPLFPFDFNPELDVSAVISGPGNLATEGFIKTGLGQMRLTGNNTFDGFARVNEGTLIAASSGALGSANGITAVNNNAVLAVDGGITINYEAVYLASTNPAALDSRNGVNTWNGAINLTGESHIHVNDTLVSTFINGSGGLTKTGSGTLTLGGALYNTYGGGTLVEQGILELNKSVAVTAVPGNLTIGTIGAQYSATARNLNSYQVVGNIEVDDGGLMDVNGQTENVDVLDLHGNGKVQTGYGRLILKTGGAINVYPESNSYPATISGWIDVLPGTLPVNVSSAPGSNGEPGLNITAQITSDTGTGGLQKNGVGWLRLGGTNTYTGTTTVSEGELQVDGSQMQSPVQVAGGILQGHGTVGTIDFTGASGIVAPGASPGILECSNFNAGTLSSGTLQIELNGSAPGSGYDQVDVLGSVNLSGVTLTGSLGFASSVSNQFTIINNDRSDAVVGTFTGLSEGTNFNLGGKLFQITYAGGNGNDVVLTRLLTPQITVTTLPATDVTNYALDFDGDDDVVDMGTNSFPGVTNNFTIELWVDPSNSREETGEATSGYGGISGQRYAVYPDNGDLTYGADHAGAGLSIGLNGLSVVEHAQNYLPTLLVYSNAISGWTHVALVYSNREPRLYLNGLLARIGLTGAKTFVHPSVNLGGHAYGNFQGQLDEVRVWNTALTQDQIQTNLLRRLTGSEPNLVAYYRCDEGSGTLLTDSAPAAPNGSGTLTNGAAFVLSGMPAPDPLVGPTVTLNGLAIPEGLDSTVWFEWGTTTNYGNVTVAQPIASSLRNVSFFEALSGLADGEYHFRAVGSNSVNTAFGLDQSFVLQSPVAPMLDIALTTTNTVMVYWPYPSTGWNLQQNSNLSTTNWVTPSETINNDGTNNFIIVNPPVTNKYYRLFKP